MTGKPRGHEWDAKAWLGDEALSGCSFEARAVWADMISLMLLCPQVGVLASADGEPWSDQRITAAVRGDKSIAAAALAELLEHGVASRNSRGAVYCRRLVRHETERLTIRERVTAHRQRKKRHCNAKVTRRGTIGGALSGLDLFSKHQQDIPFRSKAFEAAVIRWLEHKSERHETYKPTGFLGLLKRLAGMGEQRAIDAIAFSISNNYQGVFEPRGSGAPARSPLGNPGQHYDPQAKDRDPTVGKW
jgi:hypothetical protein